MTLVTGPLRGSARTGQSSCHKTPQLESLGAHPARNNLHEEKGGVKRLDWDFAFVFTSPASSPTKAHTDHAGATDHPHFPMFALRGWWITQDLG